MKTAKQLVKSLKRTKTYKPFGMPTRRQMLGEYDYMTMGLVQKIRSMPDEESSDQELKNALMDQYEKGYWRGREAARIIEQERRHIEKLEYRMRKPVDD